MTIQTRVMFQKISNNYHLAFNKALFNTLAVGISVTLIMMSFEQKAVKTKPKFEHISTIAFEYI